jgi:Ca2+-binding EF-hand superfamily protein
MGCASSHEVSEVDLRAMTSGAQASLSKKEVLKRCRERMTTSFEAQSQRLFLRCITRDDMRDALSELSDEVFSFVWKLFDPSDTGKMDVEHFSAGLALLLQPTGGPLETRLEEMFIMFDVDGNGSLSKDEFKSMIETTVLLNLGRLLETGEKYLEAQLAAEFSSENLAFWHAARDFREKTPEEERAAAAKRIMETYVIDGAEQEVNISSIMKTKMLQDWAISMASDSNNLPPVNLFADAENEIFQLMERDTFMRFKENPKGAAAAIDDFFQQADKRHDDVVSFEEFKEFAMSRPQMVVAFSQLTETISHLLSSLNQEGRKSIADLLRGDSPDDWENQASFHSSPSFQRKAESLLDTTDAQRGPGQAVATEDGYSTDVTSLAGSSLSA